MNSKKKLSRFLLLISLFVRSLYVGSLKLVYRKLWRQLPPLRQQPGNSKEKTLKLFTSFFLKSSAILIFILIACKLFSIALLNQISYYLLKGVYIIKTAYYSSFYIVGNFSLNL